MSDKTRLFEEFPPVTTEQWEEVILKDLKGADYNKKLLWDTLEGLTLKPYYRKEDLNDLDYLNGVPGAFPYVRGLKTDNSWLVHVDVETNDIKRANNEALEALMNGANSIGFNAVRVNDIDDLSSLLKGIDIRKTRISFTHASCFRFLREVFEEYVKQQKIKGEEVYGAFGLDIFSHLMLEGDFLEHEASVFSRPSELVKKVNESFPNMKALNINGGVFHNSGGSVVQELAFTLAAANECLVGLIEKNLSIDQIERHIQFSFAVGSDYFIEIAKIRAARLLWASIVEQYKPTNKDAGKVFIHSNTSYFNKSIYDPYTNMLRLTTEAMSAIIGGTDSLQVYPFDYVYQEPNEFSKRIAKNVQILLKEESYFDKVADPASGSYYIENVTNELAQAAWNLFKQIESKGGFIEAVKAGFIQDEIEMTNEKRNKQVRQRRNNTLGTTIFPNTSESVLKNIKAEVLDKKTSQTGPYKTLKVQRKSIPFEKLRLCTEKFVEQGGKRPKVFMLPIGNAGMASARQIFSRNFFGCSGFEIIENSRFLEAEKAIESAIEGKADVVVICSSDDEYASLGVELCQKLKATNDKIKVVIAGNPESAKENLKAAGVDDFIHLRSDILGTLENYQKKFSME